jgi:glycosyltransferase involved in cell wall biosynthesis
LPAYNPGGLIHSTWEELRPFAQEHKTWEFLFVCDGCTDGSDEALLALVNDEPNVRVMRYARNRGKGYAVRVGMLRARGAYRMFTDVDLAYPLTMAETVAEQLASGDDVVIASRAHSESQIEISGDMRSYMRRRELQSHIFSLAARTTLGIRQRDPQAGLKGLSARAARLVLPLIDSDGFGFDCELLVACRFFGLHVREVPIHVRYTHAHTTTRLGSSLGMMRELLAIRHRWRKIGLRGLTQSIFAEHAPTGAAVEVVKRLEERIR